MIRRVASTSLTMPTRHCTALSLAACSPPSTAVVSESLGDQKRHLRSAKSPFGYYIARRGARKYPAWRKPFIMNGHAADLTDATNQWFYFQQKSQAFFLPQWNYITGDWSGLFYLHKRQVYTLQHATSGSRVRIRRFPGMYEFQNPSRWLIGKTLQVQAPGKMAIVDDAILSKRLKLEMIKKVLLPK